MTLSTLLIGILPSIFFGVATTLMGKTGGSDRQRVMGAVLGGLLMAAFATPFLHPARTPLNVGVSFLTGLLIGVGVCDQLRSYSVLGMSPTMPLSTGGQLILISLAGIAVFGEWLHGGASLRHRRHYGPHRRHLVPVALRIRLRRCFPGLQVRSLPADHVHAWPRCLPAHH